MADYTIAFLSQKGGVGKSTLARAIACEIHKGGNSVKLADLDTQQGTASEWYRIRLNNGFNALGSVEVFDTAERAIDSSRGFDFLVIDGAPRASKGTLEVSKHADLIVLPCCASSDDIIPTIKLAYELEKKGCSRNKIAFALMRVTTEAEINEARIFINEAGFNVLNGCVYEKPAYRQAQNEGLSIIETKYNSLNQKAEILINSISETLIKNIENN
mgnify:CR=1 FL=1